MNSGARSPNESAMDLKAHWEKVYQDKGPEQMSWFQAEARLSRELIEVAVPDRDASILDAGAGASTLVDGLLWAGYRRLTVLDLASAALVVARRRVGDPGNGVTWLEGDVLSAELPAGTVDLWHDRAVFHFLTLPADRARYVAQVLRTVRPGGSVLIATFAEDGPTTCSGLEVVRYSPAELHAALGEGFHFVESHREEHRTPWGATQNFTYCLCRLRSSGVPR